MSQILVQFDPKLIFLPVYFQENQQIARHGQVGGCQRGRDQKLQVRGLCLTTPIAEVSTRNFFRFNRERGGHSVLQDYRK